MTFANLRIIARRSVPTAKAEKVNAALRDVFLNEGKDDICARLKLFPTDKKFNVVADVKEYKFSDISSRFLCIDKGGLRWYDGSNWKTLDPYTKDELDKEFRYWRDDPSADPLRHYIEPNKFITHPTPDTAGTNYFWIFFLEKSENMTTGAHYPFGHEIEIPQLQQLSWSIIDFYRWKVAPIANLNQEIVDKREIIYLKNLAINAALAKRRPDISAGNKAKIGGSNIPNEF